MKKKLLIGIIPCFIAFSALAATPAPEAALQRQPEECIPGTGKVPPWLAKLPTAEQEKYKSSKWYTDWLSTTTSLCTDLSKIRIDNPDYKEILWRNNHRPLFRGEGVGRSWQEVFSHGLYPWQYNGDFRFPTGAGHKTSTLENAGYGFWYIFSAGVDKDGGAGYVIDAPGGINQDGTEVKTSDEKVVIFPGGVTTQHIKGAFIKENGKLIFISNEYYFGGSPDAKHFDLVIADRENYGDLPNSKLTTTPAGQTVGNIAQRYEKGAVINIKMTHEPNTCIVANGVQQTKDGEYEWQMKTDNQTLSTVVVYPRTCAMPQTRAH